MKQRRVLLICLSVPTFHLTLVNSADRVLGWVYVKETQKAEGQSRREEQHSEKDRGM